MRDYDVRPRPKMIIIIGSLRILLLLLFKYGGELAYPTVVKITTSSDRSNFSFYRIFFCALKAVLLAATENVIKSPVRGSKIFSLH